MPRLTFDWRELVFAAERKLLIAQYHLGRLRHEFSCTELPGDDVPPIPVQAHFEGVVVSLSSAENQLAEAAVIALGLELGDDENTIREGMRELGRLLPAVELWRRHEIVRDLRIIRNRAIHYSYDKAASAKDHRWRVELAGTRYAGPRELLAYSEAAVEHAQRLHRLLPSIEQALSTGPRQIG